MKENGKGQEQKKERNRSRLYLILRMFRILFFVALAIVLLIQPILNSNFVSDKALNALNTKFPKAFHWDSYHLSLLKRELQVNGFSLCENEDTLVSVDSAIVGVNPLALIAGILKVNKCELYAPDVSFHISEDGTNGFQRIFAGEEATEKEDSGDPLKFILRGVKIEKGAFSFADNTTGISAAISTIETELYYNSEYQDCDLQLILNGITYKDPQRHFEFDSLFCFSEMVEGSLAEAELYLQNDSMELSLSGDLSSVFTIKESSGNLTLKTTMPMGVLQNIIGDTTSGSGVITLDAVHKGSINSPTLDIKSSFRGRDFFYSPINTVDLQFTLDDMHAEISEAKASFISGEKMKVSGDISIKEIFPQGFLHGYIHGGLKSMKWKCSAEATHDPPKPDGYTFYTVTANGSGTGVDYTTMKSALKVTGKSTVVLDSIKTDLSLNGEFDYVNTDIEIKKASLYESDRKVIDFHGSLNPFEQELNLSGNIDSLELATILPTYLGIDFTGRIKSTIKAKGKMLSPDLSIKLWGNKLRYDTYTIGSLTTDFTSNSKKGYISLMAYQKSGENSVNLATEGTLFKPNSFSILDNPFIDLSFDAHVDLPTFVGDGLEGIVRTKGTYRGSFEKGEGKVDLSSDSIVTPYAQVEKLRLQTLIDDHRIHITKGIIEFPHAGEVLVSGNVSRKMESDLTVSAEAVRLDSIPYVADLGLSGKVSINSLIGGSLDTPVVKLTSVLDSLGYNEFALKKPILCTLGYKKELVTLAVEHRRSTVHAEYNLKDTTYKAKCALNNFPLDDLFANLKLDRLNGDITGLLSVHGVGDSLKGGEVTIAALSLYDSLKHVLSSDSINMLYRDGDTDIRNMVLSFSERHRLRVNGHVKNSGDIEVVAQGEIPFDKISSFTSEVTNAQGEAQLNLTIGGTLEDIKPSGNIYFNKMGFSVLSTDQKVQNITGNLAFSKNGNIKPVIEAEVGDNGYVLLNGMLDIDSMQLAYGDIDVSLYKVPIIVPDMADIVIGGELSYDFGEKRSHLYGALDLIEGYYYKDIKIIPDLQRKRKSVLVADSTEPLIDIDVKILPKGNFVVDNNIAYLEIAPDIQVKGSERNTILEGRAEVENGEISYLNTKFEVEKGRIDFINPERIQMDVDIVAKATIRTYIITLRVTGDPESNLDFKLEGVDSVGGTLNDEDVLSIALTGYTMEELSVTGDEALKMLLSAFVNNQISESNFKMIDRVTYEYLGENGNKFTFGEDLTRRLSTDLELEFSDGSAKQKAIFNFKIQDNVSINSFITSDDNSGGEVGFEFKKR